MMMQQSTTAMDPFTDFSRTKRVVFLIDVDPLLRLEASDRYLASVISSAEAILSFPPLSSSLFSFKPFFSSLSPIVSSSKLPTSSQFLSFNNPHSTLLSLSQFTRSLSESSQGSTVVWPPRASNVVSSLRQLLLDYSWDLANDDDFLLGTSSSRAHAVRSNLVVLFTPIGRSKNWVSQFIGEEMDNETLTAVDQVRSKFHKIFQTLNSSLVSRDMHCSWIDVRYAPECLESEGLDLIASGVRSLGWGFRSTQSIILGPVLLPFGLIYSGIAIPPKLFGLNGAGNGVCTDFRLEIANVDGKPLECRFCKLQMVSLENVAQYMNSYPLLSKESEIFPVRIRGGKAAWLENFEGGIVKVEAVQKQSNFAKIEQGSSGTMLVLEYSGKSEKDQKNECGDEFFADRVLKLITSETGETVRTWPPLWQIFLSFMYREGYWALVSLSKSNGDRFFGVLKPLSVTSAIISLTDKKSTLDDMMSSIGVGSSLPFIHEMDIRVSGSKNDVLADRNDLTDIQLEPLASKRQNTIAAVKSKRNSKTLHLFQDLPWSQLQEKEVVGLDLRLDDLYISRESKNSKKLKFLKCWKREVRRHTSEAFTKYMHQGIEAPEERENTVAEAHQPSEQPISASDSMPADSGVQNEVALGCGIETSACMLNEIPDKICKGLESKGADLGTLAQRFVTGCIYCLFQKVEMKDALEDQSPSVNADDDYLSKVASEVTGLLLREPKELFEKNKSRTSDENALEYVCREYELQILFRMEILRSEISAAIKDSVKHKFIKQICLFLECTQCHLEGFFSEWSLHNYVGKIIKSRYSEDLEEAVLQIYSKLDLLLFEEEEEEKGDMLNSMLNGEGESSQSWKIEAEEGLGEKGRNRLGQLILAGSKSRTPSRKISNRKEEDHMLKLVRAREKRERARRIASYSSSLLDLQRVWAPKRETDRVERKAAIPTKQLKRKVGKSVTKEVVCETPISKRSRLPRDDSLGQDSAMHRSSYVPRSLFQTE
ncbi:hypothetical protein SAY87_017488 [Trapa incisa]|uniref:Treslin N-terminal domain-containing protein n=1 Tax=Trapa incisa TaxID=236973 RepID=A0AAN7QU43_9MYRT|nr:hypothetical protein SAY87_017488 [Trapa incisa]